MCLVWYCLRLSWEIPRDIFSLSLLSVTLSNPGVRAQSDARFAPCSPLCESLPTNMMNGGSGLSPAVLSTDSDGICLLNSDDGRQFLPIQAQEAYFTPLSTHPDPPHYYLQYFNPVLNKSILKRPFSVWLVFGIRFDNVYVCLKTFRQSHTPQHRKWPFGPPCPYFSILIPITSVMPTACDDLVIQSTGPNTF